MGQKFATSRYHVLDQCFSNTGKKYSISDLVEMINNKLSGDDWVKYIYVCVDGYNEIWTFRIEQGCWESYRDVEYNYSCN